MKLTVISANMWLLPPPLSSENDRRIDLFSQMVGSFDVDFICLQEVWLNRYGDKLRKSFPHYYFITPAKHTFWNRTGLLICSKHKPLSSEKHTFKFAWESALPDAIGGKGWLLGKFEIKGKPINVLNIHLNCPTNKLEFRAWKRQYDELNNFLNQHKTNLIAVGDINGNCDSLLGNSSKIKNLSKGIKSFSQTNPYNRRGFHKLVWRFFNNDLDIDHVMLFPKRKNYSVTKQNILEPPVSDHYPIIAKIIC